MNILKLARALAVVCFLCSLGFGQAGEVSILRSGPYLPLNNAAPNWSVFILTSGGTGVQGMYICENSPTCTSSTQWIGPLGTGSGSGGGVNNYLSNLSNPTAINQVLLPHLGNNLILRGYADDGSNPATPITLSGGAGGSVQGGAPVVINGGDGGTNPVSADGAASSAGVFLSAGLLKDIVVPMRAGQISLKAGDGNSLSTSSLNGGNVNIVAGWPSPTGRSGNVVIESPPTIAPSGPGNAFTVSAQIVDFTCLGTAGGGAADAYAQSGTDWSWITTGTTQLVVKGTLQGEFDGTFTVSSYTHLSNGTDLFVLAGVCSGAATYAGEGGTITGTVTYVGSSSQLNGSVKIAGGGATPNANSTDGIQIQSGWNGLANIDFSGNVQAQPMLDGYAYIDGSIFTSPQSVYAMWPSFRGEIFWPQQALDYGNNVNVPTSPFFNTAIPAAPTLTFGACSSSSRPPVPSGDYFVGYLVYYDGRGQQIFTPKVATSTTSSGSQCVIINGSTVATEAGGYRYSLFGQACSTLSGGVCTGSNPDTLQADCTTGTVYFPFNGSNQKVGYSLSSTTGYCISPGQQSGPPNPDVEVPNVTIALSSATYVSPVHTSVPQNSHLIGLGQVQTTWQWGQSAPNAVAVAPIPYGFLEPGGSGTPGNAVMASDCVFSAGTLQTCSQPQVFQPFTSVNAQITLVNPAPPFVQSPWRANTQYWLNSYTFDGTNVWKAISISTGISSVTNPQIGACASVGTTVVDTGVTWSCALKGVAVAATTYTVGQEVLDSNGNYEEVTVCAGTCTSSGTPTFNANFGGVVVDNAGANQVTWTNIGAGNIVISPSFGFYTLAGPVSSSQTYPSGTLALLGSTSYNFSGCSTNATCPGGTSTQTTTGVYATGGGSAMPGLTITLTTPPTGIIPNWPAWTGGNSYHARYAWATPNGATPFLGPANTTLTPSSSQCIAVTAPPSAGAPANAVGWLLLDYQTEWAETLHTPDGVSLIPGTGAQNQYVPNLPYGQLIPIGENATVCGTGAYTSTMSMGLNTTDAVTSLGGEPGMENSNGNPGAYGSTIENMTIECGRGLNIPETYGMGTLNQAAQEHSGVRNVTYNDCQAGNAYVLGPGAQNSFLADVKDAGANSDYKEGFRIEAVPVFRGLDGATADGPSLNTQFFSRYGIHFIFPWWAAANLVAPGSAAYNFYSEAAVSTIGVDNEALIAINASSASGQNRHAINVGEIGYWSHDVGFYGFNTPIAGSCVVHDLQFDGPGNSCSTGSSKYVMKYEIGNVGGVANSAEYRCSSDANVGCFQNSTVATDTGSANAYVISYIGVNGLTLGAKAYFTTANANTGASTVNVNGLGVVNLTKQGSAALVLGDIKAGGVEFIVYDGTEWQLINPAVSGGSGTVQNCTTANTIAIYSATGTTVSCDASISANGGVLAASFYGTNFVPNSTSGAYKLGSSSNPWGDAYIEQTSNGDNAISITLTQPTGNGLNIVNSNQATSSGYALYMASTGNSSATGGGMLDIHGCPSNGCDIIVDLNDNATFPSSFTLGGTLTTNGSANNFTGGPVTVGNGAFSSTMTFGVTGRFNCLEGSTAFTQVSGGYGESGFRCDSTTGQMKVAVHGGAEFVSAMNYQPNTTSTTYYAVDTGSVNASIVALTPALTSLVPGQVVGFLPKFANTTTSPSLNVNGLGAKTITKLGTQALANNDLTTTAIAWVTYDGTYFQLWNPQTASGSGGGLSGLTQYYLPVASSPTTVINSSVQDNGTGVSTTEPFSASYVNTGSSPPTPTVGTAGGKASAEGTAPTFAASVDTMYADATNHCFHFNFNNGDNGCAMGAASAFYFTKYNGQSLVDLGVPSILGTLDQTAVSAANSGVAQNVLASTPYAGHYRLFFYADQSAGCTTVGSGSLTISAGWADATHARASPVATLTPGTADSGTGSFIQGTVDMWSAASSAITVTATFTGCSSGTWTYDLHTYVEEIK